MTLKFKNRIALFNTLAVAITTALVFFVIYCVVNKTAYNHLDTDISLEKEEVINNLDWRGDSIIINKMPEWEEAEHSQIEVNPTFLQIVNINGKVIFHSSNLMEDIFHYDPDNTGELFYNSEINKQKIRLGQFPVTNETGKIIGQLTIAVSRQESFTVLHNLILVLLISFPMVLVIHYVASSLAASKAIEPVHQLIKTASGINDSNINSRLELPERKDELYLLAQTINDLLSRIEKSVQQQRQFTSDASHEIRTPLSAIRGTLEVLIRKQREPQAYEEKISQIILQVDRLDKLLDQLLQLARIESGITIVRKDAVSLSQIVAICRQKWRKPAEEKNIDLHFHIAGNPVVTGDRFYLDLMLDNLMNNAIKYGRGNGNVHLTWDNHLRTLAIEDDGEGISAEHLPNIFDRFYRADESRSSSVVGSGLGLSIVKKLADLQNISLGVSSQSGKGSIFTLQFPY